MVSVDKDPSRASVILHLVSGAVGLLIAKNIIFRHRAGREKIMLDAPLKPEKYLMAEEVGRLVGRDERLVQKMYRAQLIDAAALR